MGGGGSGASCTPGGVGGWEGFGVMSQGWNPRMFDTLGDRYDLPSK